MLGVVIFLYLENEVKVVMYKCESWPIEKTEHQKIDAFKLVLEKTLEDPLDSKEIKLVIP